MEEKTYRHSFVKLAMMFLGIVFFIFIIYSSGERDYFLLGMAGIALIVGIVYATNSVRISQEEISTSTLLGTKSLRWSDIARVSTRGQSIRLHNRDEDMALTIDSQLGDYIEILDIIFNKRPELFDLNDGNELSRSLLSNLFVITLGLLIMSLTFFFLFVVINVELIIKLIPLGIGMLFIISWLLSAQRLILDGNSIKIVYFYKKITYIIDEIDSITLEKRRTRNGTIYYVQARLKTGKRVNLPTFQQGSALTYQILKRWYSKGVSQL